MTYDSLVYRCKFEGMAFIGLRATYFKCTNRSFEDSDYEPFSAVNENDELTNDGALAWLIICLCVTLAYSALAEMGPTKPMV